MITHLTLRSLRTSELHSETENRKRRKFEEIILNKLGDSISENTKLYYPDHVLCSDSVDLDYAQFSDDNDPIITDGTDFFEKHITDQ